MRKIHPPYQKEQVPLTTQRGKIAEVQSVSAY